MQDIQNEVDEAIERELKMSSFTTEVIKFVANAVVSLLLPGITLGVACGVFH